MKVLLYFESEKLLEKSGIGRALAHQQRALSSIGVEYTLDKQAEDYDILHINTYGINSLNQINKARKQGKKVIYHAHSTEEDFRNSFIGSNQLSPLYKKYLINLYSRADQLITPTPYAKELLEGYGIKVPICAISNGIDLDKYRPEPKKEQAFRDYFQLSADQKVIISVGLYFERKGIVIFPGYIKGDVIEGAYSGADLFFFPSYEETEGIVVLEALASKQKVLVRDIPVYHGWLQENQNSYMGRTVDEFVEQIANIVEGRVPDLSAAGYQAAAERSIEEIGKELKKVYQSVLEEKPVD